MILKFRNPPIWADFKKRVARVAAQSCQKRGAFTLVEVLLVCVLFSVIAVALFQSLSSGLKVWERGRVAAKEDEVSLFFEKITQDLTNTVSFSQIPFSGTNTQVAFASVIRNFSATERNAAWDPSFVEIGGIEYFFDAERKSLVYHRANYSLALKKKYFPDIVLVDNVQSVRFRYFYPSAGTLVTQDQAKEIIPRGVIVEVRFGSNGGDRQMRRVIPIPIGS